jgi:flagellar protein FliO/FliZ
MEAMPVITSVFALIIVLSLIGLVSFILRKYGTERMMMKSLSGHSRLGIKEVRGIDAKHKLVLVSRDNKEHLLVVGIDDVVVVESGIIPPKNKEDKSDKS